MTREQLPIYYALVASPSYQYSFDGSEPSKTVVLRFVKVVSNYANKDTKRLIFHTAVDFFQYTLDYKRVISNGEVYEISPYKDPSFITFSDKSPIATLTKAFGHLGNEEKGMILGANKRFTHLIKDFYLGGHVEALIMICKKPNVIKFKTRKAIEDDYYERTWSDETIIPY